MALEDYLYAEGSEIYYSAEFRQVVEDHLEYLKSRPGVEQRILKASEVNRHTGDLYGYLVEIKKPLHMHWVIMRCSGMRSPAEFGIDTGILYIPNIPDVDEIRQRILMTYS